MLFLFRTIELVTYCIRTYYKPFPLLPIPASSPSPVFFPPNPCSPYLSPLFIFLSKAAMSIKDVHFTLLQYKDYNLYPRSFSFYLL